MRVPEKGQFYFSFNLGWKIDLESFDSLSNPNFPVDTYMFKFAATPKTMIQLFSQSSKPLPLILKCGDIDLAK
jgi:hypothetical protein